MCHSVESNQKIAKCRGCSERIEVGAGVRVWWQSSWDFGVKPGYVHSDYCIPLARNRQIFIEKARG